ncbi:hypothetical protein ZWY2020_033132 [Hordeum vulgare]|nr:hypothetical protein ZWY2020_033132 [Hordeum vulgare]
MPPVSVMGASAVAPTLSRMVSDDGPRADLAGVGLRSMAAVVGPRKEVESSAVVFRVMGSGLEGHTCDNRPSRRRPLQLQIMGSAILGEGFFCLQFDEDAEQDGAGDLRVENAYILLADPSKFTLHILQQELKHIVVGDWDWQVSQLGDNDFLVAFPASDLLHMAKTSGKLFLLINDITTTVREMLHENIEPTKMPEVWVKLHDELSLIRLGPLRLKLACQMPENLNDTIEVWFNHEGYHVKVDLERLPKHGGAVGVQGPGPSDN